jgi:hypothetical protein
VSPGAASLALAERVAPGEALAIDVVVPTLRATAYLEVDDAHGRAWAAAVPVKAVAGEMPRASVRVPPLAPGLYWAVEAGDPQGASQLGPGSVARPFFVAASDEAALALGTDAETCVPPADPRDTARVVSACLALAGATPVPRWTALEGFTQQHAREAEKRAHGMAIALGALGVAVLLEALLLLRASASSRAGLREALEAGGEAGAESPRWLGRAWTGRAWTHRDRAARGHDGLRLDGGVPGTRGLNAEGADESGDTPLRPHRAPDLRRHEGTARRALRAATSRRYPRRASVSAGRRRRSWRRRTVAGCSAGGRWPRPWPPRSLPEERVPPACCETSPGRSRSRWTSR